MKNPEDLSRIGYVLEHPDSIERLPDHSKEFKNKDGSPAKMLQFTKAVDGTYYTIQAVPDSKAHRIQDGDCLCRKK